MPKDILLFGSIDEWNAMFFFNQIAKATEDDENAELIVRVNCNGGSPEYGMSIIEKVQELSAQMFLKYSTMAHSMALFMMFYLDAKQVECIDATKAVFHRATWGEWLESQSWFPGSIYEELLMKTNKELEKAVRARIDVEAFENLPQMKEKNLTLKKIFSMESREEVILYANDLKKLKLVSKINKLSPQQTASLKSQTESFQKCRSLEDFKMAAKAIEPEKPMETLEQLKAKHPELYALAIAEGAKKPAAAPAAKPENETDTEKAVKAGVEKERLRVKAWQHWAKVDQEAVTKGIESGLEIDMAAISELSMKATTLAALGKLSSTAAPAVKTGEVVQTEAEITASKAKVDAFEKEVRAKMFPSKKAA